MVEAAISFGLHAYLPVFGHVPDPKWFIVGIALDRFEIVLVYEDL